MVTFSERITEFISEPDLTKFKNGSSVSFKDGASMYAWFNNNRFKIMKSSDETLKSVKLQYEAYKRLKKELRFNNKLKEFIVEERLFKFMQYSKVTFNDGTLMGVWYNNNSSKLKLLDEPLKLELNRQLQLLKAGLRRLELTEDVLGAIKYVDEMLESSPKFKR